MFRDPRGPLWDRSLTSRGPAARAALRRALDLLGVRRMIVGHTQTSAVQGGKAGAILLLHGGRLVMTDVGLHSGEHTPRTALILSGSEGYEWTPQRTRLLWDASGVAR